MNVLNKEIREYREQLRKGHIQKAYRGIMAFMSALKLHMESVDSACLSSALYFGYMDMTYFAFTPPVLKENKLKIAVVYLHEEGRFEAWLGGGNRKIQAEWIERLKGKDLGRYKLSQVRPGVDSILEVILTEAPDFDDPERLKDDLTKKTLVFIADVAAIVI
jgi:hypothetical protein